MEKIRVLLADDHTILREGIRILLEAEPDMDIVGEAGDGEEAVKLALELKPDIVLMDIAMPVMNGLEATRRLRAADPDIHVLILSMHEDQDYVVPILEAGASGYVLKRTAASELVSAIRAVYEGNSFLYPSVAKMLIQSYLRRQGEEEDAAEASADGAGGGVPIPGGALPGREKAKLLTPRELEVLRLIVDGFTNREIAEKLFISIKTVQAHRGNMMEKLGLHDRVELVKFAIRHGLATLDGPNH